MERLATHEFSFCGRNLDRSLDEPTEAYWCVFGRIAEQYAETVVATEDYGQQKSRNGRETRPKG